jgi:hypothetical protein
LNRTMAVLGDDVYVMEARRDESRSAWLDLARDHLNEYLDLNGRAASYEVGLGHCGWTVVCKGERERERERNCVCLF